jgi:hypothetical protein
VFLCNDEHQSTVAEDWFKALACMREQTPVPKNPAELLRSRIAIDFSRQILQSNTIAACKDYCPFRLRNGLAVHAHLLCSDNHCVTKACVKTAPALSCKRFN